MERSGPHLPPAVRSGDRIGVAALSGPVDAGDLARGLAALEALGFEPVAASNLDAREPLDLFAGTAEQRLAAFHELAADPSLAAIVFARGGHGVLPLLPRIDWHLLARHPRAYVGYSDLTPFLLEIVRRLELVAFHGPMVAKDLARGLSAAEKSSFLDALAGRFPGPYPLAGVIGGSQATTPVEGPLLGGCLSLLTAALGTPWAPDPSGALLFWEDVDEPLYRLDRMLSQFVLSNKLVDIRGMVVAHADPADLEERQGESGAAGGSARDRLVSWLREGPAGRLGCPVAWGLEVGHRAPNRTLPLGLRVRLESDAPRLVVLAEGSGSPRGSAPA